MAGLFTLKLHVGDIQRIIERHQSTAIEATLAGAMLCVELKGIYFWYIKPEGLNLLSGYLDKPIAIDPPLTEIGNNILVYVGTAGTRKTANNTGHLKQRILWHINTKHRPSNILSGTLSTLRTTLGALLCIDLIVDAGKSTEVLLNNFMREYLTFTYIAYAGEATEVIPAINADETILIKTLRPIFNIKNNPNANISGHTTNLIKSRRMLVNSNSKAKLIL